MSDSSGISSILNYVVTTFSVFFSASDLHYGSKNKTKKNKKKERKLKLKSTREDAQEKKNLIVVFSSFWHESEDPL